MLGPVNAQCLDLHCCLDKVWFSILYPCNMILKGRETADLLSALVLTACDYWQQMCCFSFPADPSTSPSLSQTTPSKDADDQSRKNMTGKNRGKRKADASSSQDSELEV